MTRSILNVFLCLLLVTAYVGEQSLPCSDECPTTSESGSSQRNAGDTGENTHHDDGGGSCTHCACCCRFQAPTATVTLRAPILRVEVLVRATRFQIPPSVPLDSIEHVPLA